MNISFNNGYPKPGFPGPFFVENSSGLRHLRFAVCQAKVMQEITIGMKPK